jgi:hypothetical protein
MSAYAKMRKSRNHWKSETADTKAKLRYKRKEAKRIKKERNYYKNLLRKAKKEIKELRQQKTTQCISDKTILVFLVLQLFAVAHIGFRAISRVLFVLAPQLGLTKTPCTQTIINWVNRFSIVRMKGAMSSMGRQPGMPLFANGFILLLDASIGLGRGKIMSVLALDANHYSQNPSAPSLHHILCVAVSVADTWTGETIADLLEKVIAQMGQPVAYLKDGGTDLSKAVRLLGEKGISSLSIDDISHFVANLLKHETQRHPNFNGFVSACGNISKRFKQTILACLAPPKVSTKAKFMNQHRLVKWASLILKHSPRGRAAKGSLLQKLRDGFGQLPECKKFIRDFLLDAEPLIVCQKILKNNGLSQKSVDECRLVGNTIPNQHIREGFTGWLDRHLAVAKTLGLHEIGMPITSDSIESLFGVAKQHGTGEIKDANRIALRIPALCGTVTWQDAEEVVKVTVKEQEKLVGSLPSLIKQRRDVLPCPGSLEKITIDNENKNIELIAGPNCGQKHPETFGETAACENVGGP